MHAKTSVHNSQRITGHAAVLLPGCNMSREISGPSKDETIQQAKHAMSKYAYNDMTTTLPNLRHLPTACFETKLRSSESMRKLLHDDTALATLAFVLFESSLIQLLFLQNNIHW